jgi:hypothetical protein
MGTGDQWQRIGGHGFMFVGVGNTVYGLWLSFGISDLANTPASGDPLPTANLMAPYFFITT